MKKTIHLLSSILLTLLLFIIASNSVLAGQTIDYNSGSGNNVGSFTVSGGWYPKRTGLKISIVSSNGTVKHTEIILKKGFNDNKNLSMKMVVDKNPKLYQNASDLVWESENSNNYLKSDAVPNTWFNSNTNKTTNLHDWLSKNDYANLKKLLEIKSNSSNVFEDYEMSDFILVEPMTYIDGFFGTGFELGNLGYKDTSECRSSGGFCYTYGKKVFGGSSTNTKGGFFYTGIYINQNIKIGDKTLTYYTYNDVSTIRKRTLNCINVSTCGRGIGVYQNVYDLTVIYHSNGADTIKHKGKVITESKLNKDLKQTFSYTEDYPNGLSDGNNPDWIYLTKTGNTFTGNWLIGSPKNDEKIHQRFGGTGEEIAKEMGLSTNILEDQDVHVYAEWTPNILKVYYNANGGTISSTEYKLESDNVYQINATSKFYQKWTYNKTNKNGLYNITTFGITREGYEFVGWGTQSDGGTIYDQNDVELVPKKLKEDITTGNRELTLYAQWEKVETSGYRLDINVCLNGANEPIWYDFYNKYGKFDFKLNDSYVKYPLDDPQYDWIGVMRDYDVKSVPAGTKFELTNIEALDGYKYIGYNITHDGGNCVLQNTENKETITGVMDKRVSISLFFEDDCVSKLSEITSNGKPYDEKKLFDLYKFYLEKPAGQKKDYRGLLNFNSPSCTVLSDSNDDKNEINNLTCLSGSTLSHANFNEVNLSQYDEIAYDSAGKIVGLCLTSMYLKNNLGVQTFYAKAGQPLVQQINNEIEIYNSNFNKVRVCGDKVATATVRKTCYVLDNNYTINSNDDVSVYFGDNNLDEDPDKLTSTSTVIKKSSTTTNNLIMYEYEKKIEYSLNSVNLSKITGKTTTSSTGNVSIKGIISNFNSTDGKIPFTVVYKGKSFGQDQSLCNYKTQKDIVDDNLQLVFRVVDTKTPFTRETKTNWSNGEDNTEKNATVTNYIINATNSLGVDKDNNKATPLYRIELTSEDIENIRKYNKEVPYDNYKIDCTEDEKGNDVCVNTFIENLKQGQVILYKSDGTTKEIFSNNSSLELNNATSNKIMSTNSSTVTQEEINGVKIFNKICKPVASSLYGNVPTGNYNIGDEYECEVKPGISYRFYVIGTCGTDKVNMIMSENLVNYAVNWINKCDYNNAYNFEVSSSNLTCSSTENWIDAGDSNSKKANLKGPLTALKTLYNLTSNWDNIVSYNYTLIDEINDFQNFNRVYAATGINGYGYRDPIEISIAKPTTRVEEYANMDDKDPDLEMYAPIELENVKARLLTRNEANACGCSRTLQSCPSFINNGIDIITKEEREIGFGYGFWLSTAVSIEGFEYCGNDITGDTGASSWVGWDNVNSIRPVITVYKSQIDN